MVLFGKRRRRFKLNYRGGVRKSGRLPYRHFIEGALKHGVRDYRGCEDQKKDKEIRWGCWQLLLLSPLLLCMLMRGTLFLYALVLMHRLPSVSLERKSHHYMHDTSKTRRASRRCTLKESFLCTERAHTLLDAGVSQSLFTRKSSWEGDISGLTHESRTK